MGFKVVSLTQIQEVPSKSVVLLVGPPMSGKSISCYQIVLKNLATNRTVIFVMTEHAPSDVTSFLRERGLGEMPSSVPRQLQILENPSPPSIRT
jgi:KaiC/GvpD/RAD55 family RecA-like ATPase